MVKRNKTMSKTLSTNLSARKILIYCTAVFLLKLIIIANIKDHYWLGADGLNYLKSLDGLYAQGVFSNEGMLVFFPAGYPLFLYFFSFMSKSLLFIGVAIIPSLVFSISAYLFGKELLKTRIAKHSLFLVLVIIFNPTLSLSSIVLGYESLLASGILLILTLTIRMQLLKSKSKEFLILVGCMGLILSLMSFLQPRMLATGFCIILVLVLIKKVTLRGTSIYLLVAMITMSLFPLLLIGRNIEAGNGRVISNNLGITMAIGAGDQASGGFGLPQKPCVDLSSVTISTSGNQSKTVDDRETIKCVAGWYLENPEKSLELFYNKTIYFWSPWSGPVANGTTSYNPWLKINPFYSFSNADTPNDSGQKIFLRIASYAWILGGFALIAIGYRFLYNKGEIEKHLSLLILTVILINLFVTLFTIGDNRFRIPILPASLALQALGLRAIFLRIKLISE
jgi:hypothetical protein